MTEPEEAGRVVSIEVGRQRALRMREEKKMPVSRAHITPYASVDANQFQAFSDLANFVDALEKAIGMRVGSQAAANSVAAPAAVGWTVAAGNGHFLIQIADPAAAGTQAPIQHQIASSETADFSDAGGVNTYTLGVGETTRDIVDPGVTKYWRLRSRYPGSAWNGWRLYATAAGVVALAPGALKTS